MFLGKTRWLSGALLLAAPLLAQADCGGKSPLFGAGFEAAAPFTIRGDVVGLMKGRVEARVGADGTAVATAMFDHGESYELDIPALAPELVLRLHVFGEAAQEYVELASQVGGIAELELAARQSGGDLEQSREPALVVTPESTARLAVLAEANGGSPQVAPACRLQELQATLDVDAVSERTAWIKIAIEDGRIGGPLAARPEAAAFVQTTLDVMLDPQAYADEVARLESDEPARWGQMLAMMGESICDYFQGEVLMVLRQREVNLGSDSTRYLRFETADSGFLVWGTGTSPFQASCDGATVRLELDPEGGLLYYVVQVIDGVPTQVPVRQVTDWMEFSIADIGQSLVALGSRQQSRITYVEHGHLFPDQIDVSAGTYLSLVRSVTGTPFDPASNPGEYALPLDRGTAVPVYLAANGTGIVLEDGAPLAWTVDAAGALDISLPDREVRLVPYRDDGPVRDVVAFVEHADGTRRVTTDFAPMRNPAAGVTLADIPGVLRQYGGRTSTEPFEFTVRADGTATVNTALRSYGWMLESGRLVLRSCNNGPIHADPQPADGCTEAERRIFDVYERDGGFWYLYEERDSYRDFGYGNGLETTILQRLNRPYSRSPLDP